VNVFCRTLQQLTYLGAGENSLTSLPREIGQSCLVISLPSTALCSADPEKLLLRQWHYPFSNCQLQITDSGDMHAQNFNFAPKFFPN